MKSSLPLSTEPRIEILDGFRAIAVSVVVLYHYFYMFGDFIKIDPEYPVWRVFAFGYYGLNLFFMISGFVIFRSMEQSGSLKEFISKRYLRLAPTLLFGSIITYTLIYWWNTSTGRLDVFGAEPPEDFLFSFTFISPDIWNFLLGRNDIFFIEGPYWTLWVEASFYVTASLIYFYSQRGNFLRNWFLMVFVFNLLQIVFPPESIVDGAFNLVHFREWTYFSLGLLFYSVWVKRSPGLIVWSIVVVLVVWEEYLINSNGVRILFPVLIGMWTIFIQRPSWLRFLTWRPIQFMGLISYPLYILHQSAGLVVAEKLRVLTNDILPIPLLLTFVLALFILLAYFVFIFVEKPVTKTLREKFLSQRSLQA